ncbi:MAG: Hsp70 family protein [Syntrophomonadaceae bacterium]
MKLGIDFGTSYTKLAVWQDGEMLDLLEGPMPSAATYVPDLDKLFFGALAVQLESASNPSTRFFKLHLKRNRGFNLGPYSLEALLYNFFSFLKEYYVLPMGIRPDSINLSIPNNFGLKSRRALISAAQKAFSLDDIVLLPEPLAAVLGYNWAHPDQSASGDWLVIDVGGGTVDFSFISLNPMQNEILLESQFQVGHDAFSGSEVDRMVLRRLIAPAFQMRHGLDLPCAMLNERLESSEEQYWFYKWMQLAENIKLKLDCEEVVKLTVNQFYKDFALDLSFNQDDFKEAVKPVFERLSRYWLEGVYERARVLGFAGSSGWQLDGVLLLGGGSQTLGLSEVIAGLCPGVPVIRPATPDLYVIKGLARWPEYAPTGRMRLKTIYPFRFYREQKSNSGNQLEEIPFDSAHLELDFAGRYEIGSLNPESPDNISEDSRRIAFRVYEAAEIEPQLELERFMDQEPVLELDIGEPELKGPLTIYLNLANACLELDNNNLVSKDLPQEDDILYKARMKQRAAYDLVTAYKFMDEMLVEDYAQQLENYGVDDSQTSLYRILSLMKLYGDK